MTDRTLPKPDFDDLLSEKPEDQTPPEKQSKNNLPQRLAALAHMIGKQYAADFIVYSGDIGSPSDINFRTALDEDKQHDKVIFWLSTYGGVPDSAYRIARVLQSRYEHITIIIDRYCKSSGTLISLAADEIWMTESGELGPLDIQLLNKDEFLERNSGLDSLQALNTLSEQSASLFSQQFINARMGGRISTKQAMDIASRISVGLMSKIYEQIEPLRLGEVSRSMRIAYEYGERLNKGNLRPNALGHLIAGYPSHGYVIDYKEASDRLFHHIKLIKDDLILATLTTLDKHVTRRIGSENALIIKLNEFIQPQSTTDNDAAGAAGTAGAAETASAAETAGTAETAGAAEAAGAAETAGAAEAAGAAETAGAAEAAGAAETVGDAEAAGAAEAAANRETREAVEQH